MDARYLQLTDLEIPYEVEQRNLRTLIITEETARETFQQQAAVIEKETEQLVSYSVCFLCVLYEVVWLFHRIVSIIAICKLSSGFKFLRFVQTPSFVQFDFFKFFIGIAVIRSTDYH